MLQKVRSTFTNMVMATVEFAGLIVSFCGATVAIFLGKLFAAAILAALTLGIFLRISGRRQALLVEPVHTPHWVQLFCAFLSLVEVAVLTEATNLPVRLTQPDFEKINWLFVILALLIMYFIQVRFFRSVLSKRNGNTLSIEP